MNKILLFGFIILGLSSCTTNNHKPMTQGLIEHEGYILTSEQIDNGYFNNKVFYFFPVDKVVMNYQSLQFLQNLDSVGSGFSIYSSYYIRLINCMGIDLISYKIDKAKSDPFKLKIEYWKILPVKIVFEFNEALKNNTNVIEDSLMNEDGSYKNFHFRYIGKISIKSLDILLQKDDDLSGNESIMPMRKYGIFGKEKNNK
jgi:hypothetical protein